MISEIRKQPPFDVWNQTEHFVGFHDDDMLNLIPTVERGLFTYFKNHFIGAENLIN